MEVSEKSALKALLNIMPQVGEVVWIGTRPQRRAPLLNQSYCELNSDSGISNDHYEGQNKKRQVTLIQSEHIATVQAILGKEIDPSLLRRNIVVKGINLLALKNRPFKIGDQVILVGTGICYPCSRMEENLGLGGYNAMRGHGGITASIMQDGFIHVGDSVNIHIP